MLTPICHALWSALPPESQSAAYDPIAAAYDRIVGNGLYNRLVWGASRQAYAAAAREALAMAPTGTMLDCGSGSLVFTAEVYRDAARHDLILFDRSLGMMKRGANRLPSCIGLQGDALAQPFKNDSFDGGMAWGVLHIFGTASPLLGELARVLAPRAQLTLSTLVLSGRPIGDRMLRLLHRRGEAAVPETAEAVLAAISGHFRVDASWQEGSMLFVCGSTITLSAALG